MTKVTFLKNHVVPQDITVDAEPGQTLLEIAEDNGIPLGSNCGGVCGCSTCHVHVVKGFDSLPEMEDDEADRIDLAFDVRLESRLGCQATLQEEDLTVNVTEESLKSFFDEHPDDRREFEETGKLVLKPRHHH